MAGQADGTTGAALEALAAERDLYGRILELSRRGHQLAVDGRHEELLAVLADKGRLAEQVAAAGERTRELKAAWAEKSAAMPAAERDRGAALIGEIRAMLEQILAEDAESQKLLGGRRAGVLEEILRMQQGRRANQAYGQRPAGPAHFRDEKK